MQWQARYETEKELVGLLRNYDAAYKAYMDGAGDGSDIVFSLRGVTVLTDANVSDAWVVYNGSEYCACIELDNSGAKILADITATNVGEQLEIVEINGDHRNVLLAPTINGTIGNGKITLAQSSEAAAKELCGKFSAGAIKNAAVAYNAKRATVSDRTANGGYLPAKLPESPEYLDVSAYLQKAADMGF